MLKCSTECLRNFPAGLSPPCPKRQSVYEHTLYLPSSISFFTFSISDSASPRVISQINCLHPILVSGSALAEIQTKSGSIFVLLVSVQTISVLHVIYWKLILSPLMNSTTSVTDQLSADNYFSGLTLLFHYFSGLTLLFHWYIYPCTNINIPIC